MNITAPGDRITQEWAQLLRNLRCYRIGEWRQRPGLSLINDLTGLASGAVLFGSRVTDPISGLFRRLFGTADGEVYADDASHTSFALSDSGYDGNPFTRVIARPERSPSSYLFLANGGRQRKFDYLGNVTSWGLVAPTKPLVAELVRLAYKIIDDCNSAAGFVAVAGVASLQTRIGAIGITHILYDSGSTGWASVAPATLDEQWQEGVLITTSANVETIIIESIYPAISTTTIDSIKYDSGSTGPCTIQFATPTLGLQRNSMIRLNGTENVRVLSVTEGLDGIPSIRCSTVGTFATTNTVDGLRSLRAYFVNTHTTAETISTSYVQLAIAASGLASLTKVGALDLSATDVGATRPVQEDDYIHVSFKVSDFAGLTEIQLQLDIDSTTNDFTQNYFFKSIRPPDLLAAIKQTATSLTAQQQEIQRGQIDDFRKQQLLDEKAKLMIEQTRSHGIHSKIAGIIIADRLITIDKELGGGFLADSGQGTLSDPGAGGSVQWSEFKIPIKAFQRVGSDTSRGWKDIASFRISVNATAAVDVGVDALWIGGSYGPDFSLGETTSPNQDGQLIGYNYIYRGRNTLTGGRSNPSPPLRSPVYPEREAVLLTIPSGYSDAQADVFDIYRSGGTIPEYHYLASIPSSGGLTFTDGILDDIVMRQPILEFDRFKPWVRPDSPKAGTCSVVGTTMTRTSGSTLNTAWVRGTQLLIDNKVYSFYTNPSSTSQVELNESAGTLAGVSFEIPEPLLDGQPVAITFGPYGGGVSGEFIFSLGDPINPGYLYWTNGNDPESCSDLNILELCSPSERLQSGCILDGIIYVWSDQRSWRILPSFSGGQSNGGSDFYAQATAMGKGLASRWGLAWGDQLYFISWDGIYTSKGDVLHSLTDESIAPLFRRDATASQTTSFNGIYPISFLAADEKYLSLTYSKDGLYLTYKGTDGNIYSWYYSFLTQGWMYDSFSDPVTRVIREEGPGVDSIIMGSLTGKVYNFLAIQLTDNATSINCSFISAEEDWGDSRAQKQLGDMMIDVAPAGNTINCSIGINNDTTSLGMAVIVGSARDRFIREMINTLARSISLGLGWLGDNGTTKLYEWQPAALLKPEFTAFRSTDWDQPGGGKAVWLQGMRLRADTFNIAKDIVIETDDGVTVASLTITHNGELTKPYIWTPIVVHSVRIRGVDGDNWRNLGVEWIVKTDSEKVSRWHTQFTSLGLPGYWHIRDILIAHESTANISLSITIDNGSPVIYTIPHGSGSRIRSYLSAKALKGKYIQFIMTSSADFRLYLNDCEVRVKAWGMSGSYQVARPFGEQSFDGGDGARI